ncbi:DUF5686 family protein [Polaribacter cellanae]|uniref:Carboxypeptidase-like regulatory domain-containing protein n=1 Tax=Polaribacter cellanae TaxID=2818493 RepID=A0A975CUS4_9FLAO|nr:DUF5686 family protein [Polaribacter cellanae]QTE23891.1 carboxypeptidase-like regulatory domain-containing protein [Polaribacter cellanae]
MRYIIFLIFSFLSFVVNAQLTIKGKVVDENGSPLAFVNVFALKTTQGTVTDDNGEFTLHLSKKRAKIEISFLGFLSQQIKVNKKTTYLKIVLKEASNQLEEIVLVTKPKKRLPKKENPAYPILKQIWKNKKTNGLKLFNYYKYKKLLTTEIGLNNLDTIFLKKIFKKGYKNILAKLPYNDTGVNFYLPLFISETVTNIYGNNITNKERIDVEAEKSNGMDRQGFIFERVSTAFNNINIYEDNFQLFKKSFVSPISRGGFDTYDYVLQDSIVKKDHTLYNIYFFPRRNDLAFEGNFWVTNKTFAITKIKMKTNKDINLNFVRRLSLEKEYLIKKDTIYLPKRDVYNANFTLNDKDDKKIGITVKKIAEFSKYEFDKPKQNNFYTSKIIRFKPNQFRKKESYWDSINNNNLKSEKYTLINDVKNDNQIRKITGIINTLSTGYFTVTPKFQIGQYWNTFSKNSVEGVKLKLGFRTFKTQNDRFRINGFIGYGIKDKKIKYYLDAKYLLSYKPRIGVGISYLNDTEQLGAKLLSTNGLNAKLFDPNALFSRGNNFFLSSVNRKVIQFDIELKKNLHIGTSFAHNNISSAANRKDFTIDYLDNNGNIQTELTNVSQDFYITYTPGRFEFGFGIEQRIGKNLYPSIILNYRKGYKGFLNGSFNYDKLSFSYTHPILTGKLGLLLASLDGGKTFGTVPLPLLNPIPANQTFWITKNTFSLINYYDFVTDTYISGHFEQHFNGLIMNRLPLLKHLKLRSLITFKTVYGTISDKNIAINKSNIIYKAPDTNMYYEYGFGFENIGYKDIRPLRVDFIWRGDHKSVNGLPSPKFAVRIGVKVDF